jgi:hypothetical protein
MNRKSLKRIEYEKKTVNSMIKIYCKEKHGNSSLCDDCNNLLNYALKKIDLCPFLPDKPTCKNCKVHCYKPDLREKIREVMRYSGPKMLFHHPYLTIIYLKF